MCSRAASLRFVISGFWPIGKGNVLFRCAPFFFPPLSSLLARGAENSSSPRQIRLCPYCRGTLVLVTRLTVYGALPPHLCPKSFPNDRNGIFRAAALHPSSEHAPNGLFSCFSTPVKKSLKRHSNRMSIRDAASFK